MNRIALLTLLACLLLPSAVYATTGGPSHAELLGYDAADAKIYYLIHPAGEVDDFPALHFMRLEGDAIGRPVFVKSYYPGGNTEYADDAVAEQFERRITRLRARLSKLTVAAESKRSEEQQWGGVLPNPVRGVRVKRIVTQRWRDDNTIPCRDVSLEISRGKQVALHSLTECGPSARVSALYQPAGRPEVLAILSFKPDSDEGGYEHQSPVLLR